MEHTSCSSWEGEPNGSNCLLRLRELAGGSELEGGSELAIVVESSWNLCISVKPFEQQPRWALTPGPTELSHRNNYLIHKRSPA